MVDKNMKKTTENGVSIIEALVATVIIGIGFVAVFQMVQYSIRSIDVSGERTKASYLTGMVAEDLYSDKNQEKGGTKFIDLLKNTPWKLETCDNSGSSSIPLPDFSNNNAYDNKTEKWKSRLSKDYIKCRTKSNTATTGGTADSKVINMYKICHKNCDVTLNQAHDVIYMGRMEVNMNGGTKKKVLYFQVK